MPTVLFLFQTSVQWGPTSPYPFRSLAPLGSPLVPRGAPIQIPPIGSQPPPPAPGHKRGSRKRGVLACVSTRSGFVKYLPFFTTWAAGFPPTPTLELALSKKPLKYRLRWGGLFVCFVVVLHLSSDWGVFLHTSLGGGARCRLSQPPPQLLPFPLHLPRRREGPLSPPSGPGLAQLQITVFCKAWPSW